MAVKNPLPRWRGFNLLELYSRRASDDRRSGDFHEDDFRWISDWGFDFVRLPLDYRLWTPDPHDDRYDESVLESLDRAVRLGERYGIHVSISLHAAPGYCINHHDEPFNLWTDAEAQHAFNGQWSMFARRYAGIPASKLSFNLLNEPKVPTEIGGSEIYEGVAQGAIEAIHAVDPERLVIADGARVGREPLPHLAQPNVAQGCRAYDPSGVSHWKAGWVNGAEDWPKPTWPQEAAHPGGVFDQTSLEAAYAPWIALAESGTGVHCGEGGSHQFTPHDVALAWFEDVLKILTGPEIGYALWNFRGSFGILDSGRTDVAYKDWYGHQLDRVYLDLLQRY